MQSKEIKAYIKKNMAMMLFHTKIISHKRSLLEAFYDLYLSLFKR